MITTTFQEKSNIYHISEPIIAGRFFQTLCLYVDFGAVSLIHSAPQRNAATLRKVFAPFSVSHVIAIDSCSFIWEFLYLFFLFNFITINFAFSLLGLVGYQIIITTLELHALLPSYLSYPTRPARPHCAQICVYPRAFMTWRVAQFSRKIVHLSFSMGPRGPRTYGLRP